MQNTIISKNFDLIHNCIIYNINSIGPRKTVELMKNELLIYINTKDSCLEFKKNIKDYTNFLKAATNKGKYSCKD